MSNYRQANSHNGKASAYFMNADRELKKLIKILFAAHHYCYISKDVDEIARIVRVKKKTLEDWMTSPAWYEALMLWGYSPDLGDLKSRRKRLETHG